MVKQAKTGIPKPSGKTWARMAYDFRERAEQAEKERDEARRQVEHQTDWYQQRFNRLRRWVKEEVEPLSKEVAYRYFSICANGSPAPHEQADWRDTMHGLTIRAERAEADAARLREALEAMLYDTTPVDGYPSAAAVGRAQAALAGKAKP